MSYTAIIAPVRELRPHSNADRLQVGTAAGYQVIVSLDHKNGERGIVFPEGGQISPSLGVHAKLYRKHPETGEGMGGYLDPNGRVTTLKLRGEASRGLWLPLDAFDGLTQGPADKDWDIEHPEELPFLGDTRSIGSPIDALGGVPLCRKYISAGTRRALRQGPQVQGASKERAAEDRALTRHYDTGQLRESIHALRDGQWIVTLKMHGTSGRTGRVPVEIKLPWYKRWWNRISPVGKCRTSEYRLVTGTRRTAPVTANHSDTFRREIHDLFWRVIGLDEDETWYYEIVGYRPDGRPIMGSHDIRKYDKALRKAARKLCGDGPMVFSYGQASCTYGVYVYRVVRDGRDLTYSEMVDRVTQVASLATFPRPDLVGKPLAQLSQGQCIRPVPLLAELECGWLTRPTIEDMDRLTRWDEHELEQDHFREGIVVHVERDGERITRGVKHKGYEFCVAEGIKANDPKFVDAEEVA